MSERYYFGAYLEVKTKLIKEVIDRWACGNDHSVLIEGSYCHHCGNKLVYEQIETSKYPTIVYDHLLSDLKWDSVLTEMNSAESFGLSVMRLGPNRCNAGTWLNIVCGYYAEGKNMVFPSSRQVTRLKKEFSEAYTDIIAALEKSGHVVSLKVVAGYVAWEL